MSFFNTTEKKRRTQENNKAEALPTGNKQTVTGMFRHCQDK